MREKGPERESVLLAMETSGDVCGVAVLRSGRLISEHTFRHGMHLSERLMDHVEAALSEAEATLGDVMGFGVGIGPGSFTGTRVGVMTMKTFAEVERKPLVGVGGLDALAAHYGGLDDTIVVPMLPCRAGVVYACPFRVHGRVPEPLAEPSALRLQELADSLDGIGGNRVLFCGAAASRFEAELREIFVGRDAAIAFGRAAYPRAAEIGSIAHARHEQGRDDDPMTLVPLYISPPPITMRKESPPIQENSR